ncbi:MAG TPA: alginate lyase family protein [Terriglobia bacterium]|nr:alginate lyase family protein [Terriglobia bacterium]
MTWDELNTRVAQEVSKHLDLASYRVGLQRRTNGLRHPEPQAATIGKFFFSPDDLPQLTALLRQRLSAEAQATIREADELCRHRFRLLGYADLDYGSEIDWHFDAVHGKRAPLEPWFKIQFLNFAEVGDHKVTWELNRHQHLVTLAKAWRLTGEVRYVDELLAQWHSWQRANPYPLGINWASTLEVAFRSLSWLWVGQLLADCEAVTQAFRMELLRALGSNGRYIERYLSTYFSPNTHLLGEAVGLFFIGTLCPEIPAARRWQQRGWRIVVQEAGRQVRPDGVYFEQALYYHVYALDFFLHARQLALSNQIAVPVAFDQTLVRMLEVLSALSQAGPPEGFGDDDGGRVFNPRRNRAGHLTDPLALGAGIYGRADFKCASPLTEEAIWLLGVEGVSRFDALSRDQAPIESKSFEAGGLYVIAGSRCESGQLVIDAGPQGIGRSGHGHADALSVSVSVGGRRCLVEPGTYCYIDGAGERDLFRGTGAHNTLRVDGKDQAVPDGPFAWSSIPSVRAERWLRGNTFTLFAGSHTGYERLPDPVLHRRFVLRVSRGPRDHGPDGGLWLVRDVAGGREAHELEIFWHFAPDLTISREAGVFKAGASNPSAAARSREPIRLALMPARDSGWDSEVISGWVAPAYGVKEPAPVLRSGTRIRLPAECATLLLPFECGTGLRGESTTFAKVEMEFGSASAYRFDDGSKTEYFVFAQGNASDARWGLAGWTSDAQIFYARVEQARPVHLILCEGSFVEFRGEAIVRREECLERFEWVKQDGQTQTFSSDEAASGRVETGESI